MKKVRVALVFLSLFGNPAQAQQLPVRSGDHNNFSRLTILMPASQTWEARQTIEGVEISLPGFAGGFDVSGVFARMNRDRIQSLESKSETLKLNFECDCIGTVFRSGGLLVVDVANRGTILAGPPLPSPQEINTAEQTAAPFRTQLPWIGGTSTFNTMRPVSQIPSANSEILYDDPQLATRSDVLKLMQKNLAEEFADAASSGLLENSLKSSEVARTSEISFGDVAKSAAEEIPSHSLGSFQNLRITNSMSMLAGFSIGTSDADTGEGSCPTDDFLAIATWGDETEFSAQIATARDELMDVRDHLNKHAAVRLAKLYIYFGFGAEALDVLKLDQVLSEEYAYLSDVAAILENRAPDQFNLLRSFSDCDSDVALWASLSFQHVPSGTLINIDAALRAVNKLPIHLRHIIAAQLSDRLLQYGDPEAAATALRSIERLTVPLPPPAVLAQATLALDANKPADDLLAKVIETNSAQSPEAIIQLVETRLAKDKPLSREIAALVEAYAQEFRGTELGARLRQTEVVALSQSQQFDKAIDAIEALSPSLSPQTDARLRSAILNNIGKNADDFAFLGYVLSEEFQDLSSLPMGTKLILATRLMNLGFAKQVQQILDITPESPRNSARQILAARAAIQLRQPFQAQAALIGVEGEDAALLLARAKEMVGAYSEAAEIFLNSNAHNRAAQAAWLSDDWRELTPTSETGFGAVAALVRSEQPAAQEGLGPLQNADRALEESAAARTTLEQLLRDPSLQVKPDS